MGVTPCPGVRPGAIVRVNGNSCTLNFLFRGSDGHRYIGTAGHCFLAAHSEMVFQDENAVPAGDVSGNPIGTAAYAIFDEVHDFALIRLFKGVRANAKMCHFGGPTAINSSTPAEPVVVHHYGNGTGLGHANAVDQPIVPARSAVARDLTDPVVVQAFGAAVWGDSGSAVIDDRGKAVGVLTAIASPGLKITRLLPQMRLAERALRAELTLQTADFAE